MQPGIKAQGSVPELSESSFIRRAVAKKAPWSTEGGKNGWLLKTLTGLQIIGFVGKDYPVSLRIIEFNK